jgi:hypothetical protein
MGGLVRVTVVMKMAQDCKTRDSYSSADNIFNKYSYTLYRFNSLKVLDFKTIDLNESINVGVALLRHSFGLKNSKKCNIFTF